MSDLMERCLEEISTTVLDVGEPCSYRMLCTLPQSTMAVSQEALAVFAAQNKETVGALNVVVQQGVLPPSNDKKKNKTPQKELVDPRTRVIRIGSLSPSTEVGKVVSKRIYGVYKKASNPAGEENDEPVTIACWSQERKLRNEIFAKVAKQEPLSLALRAFYDSEITCREATNRTEFGDSQGEEAVSVFDSIKSSKANVTKSSLSSSSFFKTSSTIVSKARPAPKTNTTKPSSPPQKPVVKKITAETMSNVFTIDSDEDEESDNDDAPVFVKKSTANGQGRKPQTKRIISDDEEDDDEDDKDERPPAKKQNQSMTASHEAAHGSKTTPRNVKRKLSTSPDEKKSKQAPVPTNDFFAATSAAASTSASDDETGTTSANTTTPAVVTKRRVLVSKTRINEQGYMVTEKVYEEVELTPKEIAKEQQTLKKQESVIHAAKSKKTKTSSGPAKQKDLRSFFMKK